MKFEYRRFRIAMMMFALGLAAVYMINGLSVAWSEVPVDLPKISSGEVIPVFIDNKWVLRRDTNCGFDPNDLRVIADCTRQNLFEGRDMTLYEQHHLTCDYRIDMREKFDPCPATMKALRNLIWRHWSTRTRGYIVVSNPGDYWNHDEDHYFIEPNLNKKWRVVIKGKSDMWFIVNGIDTAVGIVWPDWAPVSEVKWKTATKMDEEMGWIRGTRCLLLVDEKGQERNL
jgi:hypothetical protein